MLLDIRIRFGRAIRRVREQRIQSGKLPKDVGYIELITAVLSAGLEMYRFLI